MEYTIAPEGQRLEYTVARLVVVAGAEKFQPLSFNSFEVASVTAVVDLPPGASVEEVYADVYARLSALQERQFREKCDAWVRHYIEARDRIKREDL